MKPLRLLTNKVTEIDEGCYVEINSDFISTVGTGISNKVRFRMKLILDLLDEMGYKIVRKEG